MFDGLEAYNSITHLSNLVSSQHLPSISLPNFNGSPIDWIDFIVQFRDTVHKQPHLTGTQRMNYLLQSLYGEAKLAVKGFTHDWTGYVLALKRLKLMFARRSHIVHAHIDKVLCGTKIEDIDSDG